MSVAFLFLIVIVLGIFIVVLLSRTEGLRARLDEAERRLRILEGSGESAPARIRESSHPESRPADVPLKKNVVSEPPPSRTSEPVETPIREPQKPQEHVAAAEPAAKRPQYAAAEARSEQSMPVEKAPAAKPIPKPARQKSELWQKIERQLIENWTGMLGAVILTAGLGFLAVYAALSLAPVFRFFMMLAIAGSLAGAAFYLEKKPDWKKFSSWLTAAGGAVLLVSCFAAVAIPGVKWIENETAGLLLIIAGVLVNLFFAYRASAEAFASLHLLLSLIVLAVLPPALPVLLTAAGVALAGVLLAARSRWEFQAVLCTVSFALYQVVRYFAMRDAGLLSQEPTDINRLIGILSTAAVASAALLQHYRAIFQSDRLERLPFFAHLVHWATAGLGFLLYATGSKWNTIVLALATVVVFLLARYARRLRILWLYRTDTLIAQGLAFFCILTLGRWQMDAFHVGLVMFVQTMLFFALMNREGEEFLESVGLFLHLLSGVIFIALATGDIPYSDNAALLRRAGMMLALLLFSLVLYQRTLKPLLQFSSVWSVARSIIQAAFLISLYALLLPFEWSTLAVSAVAGLVFFAPHPFVKDRTAMPVLLFLPVAGLMLAAHLISGDAADDLYWRSASLAIPFLVLAVLLILRPARLDLHDGRLDSAGGMVLYFLLSCLVLGIGVMRLDYSLHSAAFLAGMLLTGLALHRFLSVTDATFPLWHALGEVLHGLYLSLIFVYLLPVYWATTAVSVLAATLVFIPFRRDRSDSEPNEQRIERRPGSEGIFLFLLIGLPVLFVHLFDGDAREMSSVNVFWQTLPFLALFVLQLWRPASISLSFAPTIPVVWMLALFLGVVSYRIFEPISAMIPGVVWLLLSLVALESSRFLAGKEAHRITSRHLLYTGSIAVLAFLIRHVAVELQSEYYLGPVTARLLIQVFAIVVFLFWFTAQSADGGWFERRIQTYYLELAIAMGILAVELEVPERWTLVVYAATPALFVALARTFASVSRLSIYGLFLFWWSVFYLTFLSSTAEMPQAHFADQNWVAGLIAMLVLVAVSILLLRERPFAGTEVPFPFSVVARLMPFVDRRRNLWIFDPLFLGAALFLYWSFDQALLTLLWVVLIFIVFSLSIVLRESHFRILSMVALGAALLRLIFFDLARSSTLTRALVFVGVGLLMLGMNSLYNRFKDRFTEAKEPQS